jgi:hypothetical protein
VSVSMTLGRSTERNPEVPSLSAEDLAVFARDAKDKWEAPPTGDGCVAADEDMRAQLRLQPCRPSTRRQRDTHSYTSVTPSEAADDTTLQSTANRAVGAAGGSMRKDNRMDWFLLIFAM